MIEKLQFSDSDFFMGEDSMHGLLEYSLHAGFAMILMCEHGSAEIKINLKEHRISRNSQVIILPDTIISMEKATEDFSVKYIAFSKSIADEICFKMEPVFFGYLRENPVFHPEKREYLRPLKGLFYNMETLNNDSGNIFRTNIAKDLLKAFLYSMYDKIKRFLIARQDPMESKRQIELFKNFVTLVIRNCGKEREASYYADELGISPKYLSDICKNIGKNPTKRIIDAFTVQEIKIQLQSTTKTIGEIAHELSFPDQSYLGRFFKRMTGISPNDYRKSCNEASANLSEGNL